MDNGNRNCMEMDSWRRWIAGQEEKRIGIEVIGMIQVEMLNYIQTDIKWMANKQWPNELYECTPSIRRK